MMDTNGMQRAAYQKQYSLAESKLSAIQTNFAKLVKDTNVGTGEMVDYFFQEKILNQGEMEHIHSQTTRMSKNREFFNIILQKKNPMTWNVLLECLESAEYGNLAALLRDTLSEIENPSQSQSVITHPEEDCIKEKILQQEEAEPVTRRSSRDRRFVRQNHVASTMIERTASEVEGYEQMGINLLRGLSVVSTGPQAMSHRCPENDQDNIYDQLPEGIDEVDKDIPEPKVVRESHQGTSSPCRKQQQEYSGSQGASTELDDSKKKSQRFCGEKTWQRQAVRRGGKCSGKK